MKPKLGDRKSEIRSYSSCYLNGILMLPGKYACHYVYWFGVWFMVARFRLPE